MATTGVYRFKELTLVPQAKDLVDVVLSKTQRKTPTQIHPQFHISRVRRFYMRKVKFCQQSYRDKLSTILTEFPRLDEVHPFYGDLCNVLYDRDHYKLALGQCNSVRNTVDSLGKDYVRLLKYADSHYKCKMLKRAALGRMATTVKKLQSSLQYLEEVRQHMSRLPSINPTTRTLILAGFPNVGKSSFMNSVSFANVDVQPYAFTTKSLFVGHFDYQYARWQVIDTPGILDHPLENRNTIEMTAITAMAHLTATIVYFLDVSEQCGYSIKAQTDLFHSIKPLFKGKPLVVALNKIDACPLDKLSEADTALISGLKMEEGDEEFVEMFPVSCLTKEGIDDVKLTACDRLLSLRLQAKCDSKKLEIDPNQLTITNPAQSREPAIPDSVKELWAKKQAGIPVHPPKTEKDMEEEFGGAGVYSVDWRKYHLLEKEQWRYDVVPEFFEGRNVADFVDPEIEKKLIELEAEEEKLLEEFPDLADIETRWRQTQKLLDSLHRKLEARKLEKRLRKGVHHRLPFKAIAERKVTSEVIEQLDKLGYETDKIREWTKSIKLGHHINLPPPPADSSLGTAQSDALVEVKKVGDAPMTNLVAPPPPADALSEAKKRLREVTRGRLITLPTGKKMLMKSHTSGKTSRFTRSAPTVLGRWKLWAAGRTAMKKKNKLGKRGEADRHIPDLKPKHLFSGKRGIGKTQRR